MADSSGPQEWAELTYEPELSAFGGCEAIKIAHEFHRVDSLNRIAFAGTHQRDCRPSTGMLSKCSLILCSSLMKAAGLDWYEQGDVWTRLTRHRPPLTIQARMTSSDVTVTKELLTNRSLIDSPVGKMPCAHTLHQWAVQIGECARMLTEVHGLGKLTRGIRGVLCNWIVFHWNRLGIPYGAQSRLASFAVAVTSQ